MALPLVALGGLLSVSIVPLVVKVLVTLGFGYTIFTGLDLVMDAALAYIQTSFGALPSFAVSMMAIANVDKYVTMLFSAYTVQMTLAGLNSAGVLSKFGARGIAAAT